MPTDHRAELAKIRRFDQLIAYLRDEMGWPIARDSFEDVDDLFYDFTADELGIDPKTAAKIESIKRLRPLSSRQPWGIFFVKFEPKRLPVVALRRILSRVALKKRASANRSERAAWTAGDLLFVSNYGDGNERQICFAHFSQAETGRDLPTLKVLGWDNLDTALHLDGVAKDLIQHLAWPDDEGDLDAWRKCWRSAFTLRYQEVVTTSKELSIRLAKLARDIRDRIRAALAIETETAPLTTLMKAFQEALVHDLDADGFADMYAQTIAYGLLSARIADPNKKTTDDFAAHMRTNPFLRELMETFLQVGGRRGKAGGPGIDFDELGVSEVVELLDDANMEAVVRDFGDRNPQEDPVIHFYELFLKEYDAKKRVQRGVFYTPRPVVSFIVRSVDEVLRTEFGLADGLADTTTWGEMVKLHKHFKCPDGISPEEDFVQILDPATGTGTFLVEVIDLIYRTMTGKWKVQGRGDSEIATLWDNYVSKHLLPRLHGYELLMAPYAIAHLKVGLKLFETGYRFGSDQRVRIYLTNALEPASDFSSHLEFSIPSLAHEAEQVNTIKRHQHFTIILGNPPYAKLSGNRSEFAESLVTYYKELVPRERNVQPLSDDYVKFIAYGSGLVSRFPIGIISLITNRSWLNGLIHKGMRQSLLEQFRQVFVLDCHGDNNVGEDVPTGKRNGNLFDIRQGVAIFCLANTFNSRDSVRLGDLWGSQPEKYEFLRQETILSSTQQIDNPIPPNFFLRNHAANTEATVYMTFQSITSIFGSGDPRVDQGRSYGNGIKSNRDGLLIDFDRDELKKRMLRLADKSVSDEKLSVELGLEDGPYWNMRREREKIRTHDADLFIKPITYRPFDQRWIWYQVDLIQIGRGGASRRVMANANFKNNVFLLTSRNSQNPSFSAVFCTRNLSEMKTAESTRASYCFPLYVHQESQQLTLVESTISVNFSGIFVSAIHECLGLDNPRQMQGVPFLAPEEILHYIYAVLHSPRYRALYEEFLKIDFPRVPLPGGLGLFRELANLGRELMALHLLESPTLDRPITKYIGPKNPKVGRVSWRDNTVFLDGASNKDSSFKSSGNTGFYGVPEAVWNLHIGGYQVCQKWLKDRKGRTLSEADISHYQRIVVAIGNTIRQMQEIDKAIEQHGGWPGAFRNGTKISKIP